MAPTGSPAAVAAAGRKRDMAVRIVSSCQGSGRAGSCRDGPGRAGPCGGGLDY